MKKFYNLAYWKIGLVLGLLLGIIVDLVYVKSISSKQVLCNVCPVDRDCGHCPSSLSLFFRDGGVWELVGIILVLAVIGLIIGIIYKKIKN